MGSAQFKDHVIAVTGGASGIGLSAAKILFSRGASLSIADVDQDALNATLAYFNQANGSNQGPRVLVSKTDVGNRQQVDAWIEDTVAHFGKLTGALNAAGVIGKHHGIRTVTELDDEQWDLIMRINLTGMMYCLRAELRKIRDGGSVVCVSSVQGSLGFAKHAAYTASKHGVIGLARSAAKEVGEKSIRVNAVSPGAVDTPLLQQRNALPGMGDSHHPTPINRHARPEEVANIIVWLLSDEASFVTGAVYAVDGGWNC